MLPPKKTPRKPWGLIGLACLTIPAIAEAKPVVIYASDPIRPGETALLFGGGLGENVTADGYRASDDSKDPPKPIPLPVLQASDLCAKVLLPAEWKPGVFVVKLTNPEGETIVRLNRAEPWWWLGAEGDAVTPGKPFRVFGKNFGTAANAEFRGVGTCIPLKTISCSPYMVEFDLPASVIPGEYELTLHGLSHAAMTWGKIKVTVVANQPWPDKRFDVTAFGAVGDGKADETAAFTSALQAAADNHGGVVYVPRGNYRITAKLAIPPFTTLQGQSRESVWLYVPKELPEIDAVIVGAGNFGVRDLSIAAQTPKRIIVCPDDPAIYARARERNTLTSGADVHLHNLRITHLRYAHRIKPDSTLRTEQEGPTTITLFGSDMEISDCQVVSSGMPIELHRSHHCRIEGNHFQTGRQGWYGIWDFDESVFLNNEIEGRDLEASYGGIQGRCERVYFAGNYYHDAYGDEREALTFDTPYYATWMGQPAKIDGRTLTADGVKWKPDQLKDYACLIAGGKGIGQYRHIVSSTPDTFTIDQDWTIAPDATSVFSVRSSKNQVVITHNSFSDASAAVQLYANCWGFIIDGNTAARTGGIYGMGTDQYNTQRKMRRFSTSSFVQYLNNDLSEGFIYQQGPFLTGILGPVASSGMVEPAAIPCIGNVVRGNAVRDNFTIGALSSGAPPFAPPKTAAGCIGRDTIIENNSISDGVVAVNVYPGYLDTVVRNNHVERCVASLHDDGKGTFAPPADRLRDALAAAAIAPGAVDKLPAIEKQISALSSNPVGADAARQTELIRQLLWTLVADQSHNQPASGETLTALIGWRHEVEPYSSVRAFLRDGKSGKAELRLRYRTEPWSPEVTAKVDVIAPEGWTAEPGPAPAALAPATPGEAIIKVSLPRDSAVRKLRCRWTMTLNNVPLIAEEWLDVTPDAPASTPATKPAK